MQARSARGLWIIFGFAILLAIFTVTRLTNLTSLPIFTDEAIYIRWSQIGMKDANWRFISLTDGKQPMFTWVMMVLLKVFDGMDPLWIGRLTSVIAGAFTMTGLWFLARELFGSHRVAFITSALYIIVPFTIWYDRMALYDSLVSTFSVWNLYAAVRLAKNPRLDTALLLGMGLGAGMLNKSSGFLTMYFLPVTLLLSDWSSRKKWSGVAKWFALVAVAVVLSGVVYSVLRLSPFFHMVGQKDNVFVFSLSEWFVQPFRFLVGNLKGMFDWLRHYLTLPIFVAAFFPFFLTWPRFRERMVLFLWWGLPFVALATFAKILYPRFILFMTMPLLVLAAYTLDVLWERVKRPVIRVAMLVLFLVPGVLTTAVIMVTPEKAPIPLSDRGQFVDDWPAGGGVSEVVTYLKSQTAHQRVSVYTEGTFGLLPYALEIYLVDQPNIKITGIWPVPLVIPALISADASASATYFVMNETQKPPDWPLTLIGEYQKGMREDRKKLRFYKVAGAEQAP